ncbi:MAG: DAK2 domain-containing protein [Clostridia bacterium]|nr:DAK2 domain-containing protein [Clostridia bacterium]
MKVERLQGTELKNLFQAANRLLTAKQDEVDALNVFPVPDGDTGTNMALTFQAAVSGMEQAAADSASKVAEAAAQGSLMGARGNSGLFSLSYCGVSPWVWRVKRIWAPRIWPRPSNPVWIPPISV